MNKKKIVSLIALICMLVALTMYTVLKKDDAIHDFFWVPLVLGAVLLFAATRIK